MDSVHEAHLERILENRRRRGVLGNVAPRRGSSTATQTRRDAPEKVDSSTLPLLADTIPESGGYGLADRADRTAAPNGVLAPVIAADAEPSSESYQSAIRPASRNGNENTNGNENSTSSERRLPRFEEQSYDRNSYTNNNNNNNHNTNYNNDYNNSPSNSRWGRGANGDRNGRSTWESSTRSNMRDGRPRSGGASGIVAVGRRSPQRTVPLLSYSSPDPFSRSASRRGTGRHYGRTTSPYRSSYVHAQPERRHSWGGAQTASARGNYSGRGSYGGRNSYSGLDNYAGREEGGWQGMRHGRGDYGNRGAYREGYNNSGRGDYGDRRGYGDGSYRNRSSHNSGRGRDKDGAGDSYGDRGPGRSGGLRPNRADETFRGFPDGSEQPAARSVIYTGDESLSAPSPQSQPPLPGGAPPAAPFPQPQQTRPPLREVGFGLLGATTTMDIRTSVAVLAGGDWFYKWSSNGTSVSPRWVWIDTQSYLLLWAHKETRESQFAGTIKLEKILQINARELQQPGENGIPQTYYILLLETSRRVLQLGTERRQKADVWYEALTNVLSYIRGQ